MTFDSDKDKNDDATVEEEDEGEEEFWCRCYKLFSSLLTKRPVA
jgi:hypothetical protein